MKILKIIRNKVFLAAASVVIGFGMVTLVVAVYSALGFEDFLKAFLFVLGGIIFSMIAYGLINLFGEVEK